ncbi:hypothetical protein DERP_000436 [Dermatophagoides pteronyssinus]|uniref:Uncharacterized protein n=1 Tax=Dermatophagoides pteronyssinus TaxID=6956 RepID=A0ABQ8J046_DERPT|nr:hypothetical protein DERP_000436 [Dermatophagoides pteronyssinus]
MNGCGQRDRIHLILINNKNKISLDHDNEKNIQVQDQGLNLRNHDDPILLKITKTIEQEAIYFDDDNNHHHAYILTN